MRRTKLTFAAASLLVTVLLVAACGNTQRTKTRGSAAAKLVAEAFLRDLASDQGSSACMLETGDSRSLQAKAVGLLSRYEGGPPGPCGVNILLPSADFPGDRTVRATKAAIDNRSTARVSFTATATGSLPNPLELIWTGTAWRVNTTSSFLNLATASGVAKFEGGLVSAGCEGSWERAVNTGQVQIPFVGQSLPSQAVWADLTSDSESGCLSMILSYPAMNYCETFAEDATTGTWLSGPCAHSKQSFKSRDVWLLADGSVENAAFASPDGTVPPLGTAAGPTVTPPTSAHTSLMCFEDGGSTPTPKIQPTNCVIFGEPEDDADLAVLTNMHWSNWGQPSVRGIGTRKPNSSSSVMPGTAPTPVTATLSGPAQRCDSALFYTTLVLQSAGQTQTLHLSGACTSQDGAARSAGPAHQATTTTTLSSETNAERAFTFDPAECLFEKSLQDTPECEYVKKHGVPTN